MLEAGMPMLPGRFALQGTNSQGQFGDGSNQGNRYSPPTWDGATWAQLSLSAYTTCGITFASALYCWGTDKGGTWGALGLGATLYSSYAPRPVVGGIATWKSVMASDGHTCGIATNGSLFCWVRCDMERRNSGHPGH